MPDRHKMLILMTSLTPETAECLYREMSPEVVENLAYTRSPAVSAPVQAQVLQEFLSNFTRLAEVGPVRDLDQLEQVAQSHPRLVIKALRRIWPGPYREVMSRRSRVLRGPSKIP